MKGYAAELGESQDRDNLDIINIRTLMDSLMVNINGFVDLLLEEVDNKLD